MGWPTTWILFSWMVRIAITTMIPAIPEPIVTESTPTVLPICSIGALTDPETSSSIYRHRYTPTHIGVLPPAGSVAQLVLTENGTFPTSPPTTTLLPDLIQVGDYHDISLSSLAPIHCSIKLEACASCTITLEYLPPRKFFDDKTGPQLANCGTATSEPCFDLEIVEERSDQSMQFISSPIINDVFSRTSIWTLADRSRVNSTGNALTVVATFRNVDNDTRLTDYLDKLFPLTTRVVDNTQIITGLPRESIFFANQTSIGFIESPRYPDSYPRNIVKNYTLVNQNENGYVRLVFDDFHVHFQSELKIIDSDGQELFNTRSEYRRPPAILSKGNTLTVMFTGHDFTQLVGFRARYEFVESALWPDKPTRHCDEYLEGYGGDVNLDNQKSLINKYIDCIWLIGRFPALSRTFDKIYLKVEEFKLKGVALRLEVRRGPSSTSERVLMLFDEQSHTQLERKQPLEGLVTEDSSQPAFYIRLRGYMAVNTGLSIVYTQFYRWATALCPGGDSEFHCDNSKCIKSNLQCDGFDHCGDASDEVCHIESTAYDAPHIDVAGALTIVIGAIGVIILLLTIVGIMSKLYRNRFLNQNTRGRNGHTRSTSIINAAGNAMATEAYCNELAPTIQTIGDRRFYVLPESQISVIEAPPTYDDALKHRAIPVMPSRQRARSAMAFVYVNDGYSPEGPPPDIENTERPSSSTPTPANQIGDEPIPRPRRLKKRLTQSGTDPNPRSQSSPTSPRVQISITEPSASPSPPPQFTESVSAMEDQPGPSRPSSSRSDRHADPSDDNQNTESWV